MVRRPAEKDMFRQPVTNGHAYTLIFLLLYPNHHHTVSRHAYLRSSSRTPGVRSAGNLLQAQHSKTHHLCKEKPMRGLALITVILSNEHQHVVTCTCQQSVAGRVVQKELLVSGPQTENAIHQRSELTPTRHGYASPKPRKSLSEATVTRLAVQSNINLLHRARKLVVCIIVRYFLAAQLQYSTFAQHHFLAFPWHCKTTICISISHSHRCLLQIGPSICQQVRITMIKNFKQDRPGVRGSCQENGMMSFCLAKYVYEDGEKCLLCFHCHREWRLEF